MSQSAPLKTDRLHIALSPDLHEQVKRRAEEEDRSAASVARLALEHFFHDDESAEATHA